MEYYLGKMAPPAWAMNKQLRPSTKLYKNDIFSPGKFVMVQIMSR